MKRRSFLNLGSQRGDTLIGVIIAAGLIVAAAFALYQVSSGLNAMKMRVNAHRAASIISNNLHVLIADTDAWQFTVADPANPSLQCLNSAGGGAVCTNGVGGAFNLRDPANGDYYSPQANPKAGFGLDAVPCNTFVAPPAEGDAHCPFRVELSWAAVCSDCSHAKAKIQVTFIYNPKQASATPLNASRYSFVFVH